jgi:hypothetical protein
MEKLVTSELAKGDDLDEIADKLVVVETLYILAANPASTDEVGGRLKNIFGLDPNGRSSEGGLGEFDCSQFDKGVFELSGSNTFSKSLPRILLHHPEWSQNIRRMARVPFRDHSYNAAGSQPEARYL